MLSIVEWQFVLFYLEDIIFYTKSITDLSLRLHTVLELLEDAGVALNFSTCSFLTIPCNTKVTRPDGES